MSPLSLDSINLPRFEIFERSDDLYDWRLVAGNGEVVCSSYQGFTTMTDAVRAIGRAVELMPLATETRSV